MALTIDILSVATQGLQEIPGPSVEANRDAVRIATLGWVLVDFSLVPIFNPSDPTFAFFTNPFVVAEIRSGETKSFVLEYSSDADVGPKITGVVVETSYLKFDVLAGNTDAGIRASQGSAKLDVESNDAQNIQSPDSAIVSADRASAIIDPNWQECRKV